MDRTWWELPGPARFLHRVWDDLREGCNVVLSLPATVPDALDEALAAQVRSADLWRWRTFELPPTPPVTSVADLTEFLHRALAPAREPGQALTPHTLASDDRLAETVVWVPGLRALHWPLWERFLGQYAGACRLRQQPGGVFCVPLVGLPDPGESTHDLTLRLHSWRGVLSPLDLHVDLLAQVAQRRDAPLHRRLALAIACELAGTDAVLARVLSRADLASLLAPVPLLRRYGEARQWTRDMLHRPRWEAGLLEVVENQQRLHSAALALRGDLGEIQRRLWRAQVGVLYPFIEEQRLLLLPQLKRYLHLPIETTFGIVTDAHDLELGQLLHFLRHKNLPRQVWRRLSQLTAMRHDLAHLRPVSAELLCSDELLAGRE